MTNRPCLDKNKLTEKVREICEDKGYDFTEFSEAIDDCFIGWFSRSMATAIFVFCKDSDGDWCVLASERGAEAADFVGKWNCPCGYLDFNEDTKHCAIRECFEETGVEIPISSLCFMSYEDNPITANRQNVTFHFGALISDKVTSDFTFSKKNNEGEEVGEIKWIKVDDIDGYQWAFNHDIRIFEIYYKFIAKEMV